MDSFDKMLQEIKAKMVSVLQNNANLLRKEININANNQRDFVNSDISSQLSSIDLERENVNRQRLTELSNTELQNLTLRNELKNLSAVSGGSVVGAGAIREGIEQRNISNIEGQVETLEGGLFSDEAKINVDEYNKLTKIKQDRRTQLQKTSENFRNQLFTLNQDFSNQSIANKQKEELNLVQEAQQRRLDEKNVGLVEKQVDSLNILKSFKQPILTPKTNQNSITKEQEELSKLSPMERTLYSLRKKYSK